MRHTLSRLSILAMTAGPAAVTFAQGHDAPAGHAGDTASHAADAAHGTEHGLMDFDVLQFIVTILVFGIAFFVLSKTAWPKILGGLEARENKIKGDLAEAEKAREQSEAALTQYQKALAEARTEAARIVEDVKANQLKVAADLKAKTEKELADMRDAAKRDITSAKSAAITELHAHVAELSTDIAGKILRRELSADDQRALVDESLGQMAAVSG